MPLERAEMLIREGKEDAFVDMMVARGLPLLRGLDGARSVELGRGIEAPDKFMLLLDWETMEEHTAFTQTPAFQEFMALLAPFTRGGAMEHFEMLPEERA